jgi:hypothetical protein
MKTIPESEYEQADAPHRFEPPYDDASEVSGRADICPTNALKWSGICIIGAV